MLLINNNLCMLLTNDVQKVADHLEACLPLLRRAISGRDEEVLRKQEQPLRRGRQGADCCSATALQRRLAGLLRVGLRGWLAEGVEGLGRALAGLGIGCEGSSLLEVRDGVGLITELAVDHAEVVLDGGIVG